MWTSAGNPMPSLCACNFPNMGRLSIFETHVTVTINSYSPWVVAQQHTCCSMHKLVQEWQELVALHLLVDDSQPSAPMTLSHSLEREREKERERGREVKNARADDKIYLPSLLKSVYCLSTFLMILSDITDGGKALHTSSILSFFGLSSDSWNSLYRNTWRGGGERRERRRRRRRRRRREVKKEEVAIKIMSRLPEHHIHYVLRQTWILKPGPNDTNHKPQSTMYGFVVPSFYIYMLAMYITIMLFFVARIFWYEFLFEETTQHSCNPSEVNCFFIENIWEAIQPSSATSTSLTLLVHLGQLDVCWEFLHSSLQCYQLAFFSWSDVMHRCIGHCSIPLHFYVY